MLLLVSVGVAKTFVAVPLVVIEIALRRVKRSTVARQQVEEPTPYPGLRKKAWDQRQTRRLSVGLILCMIAVLSYITNRLILFDKIPFGFVGVSLSGRYDAEIAVNSKNSIWVSRTTPDLREPRPCGCSRGEWLKLCGGRRRGVARSRSSDSCGSDFRRVALCGQDRCPAGFRTQGGAALCLFCVASEKDRDV